MKTYDLSKSIIGFISGFALGGRTGYQVKALVRGLEHVFDATRDTYALKDTTKYFPYPCLGEELFLFEFNDDGVLVECVEVNDLEKPGNPVRTGISMGTMRMFKKKLTAETLAFGDILKFEGNRVIFEHFDENRPSGPACGEVMEDNLCALTYHGNIPPLRNGAYLTLAPDCVIYCWDWGTATHPFCICSREQAQKYHFVTKFSIGTVEDIKRAYWVGFFSTRGDERYIDLIKCFPNRAPGWVDENENFSW